MLRYVCMFLMASVGCAQAELAERNLCVPTPKSELSVAGDFKSQHLVFMITVDGVRQPNDGDFEEEEAKPCPLVS